MKNYLSDAVNFLDKTKVKISIEFLTNKKHFASDEHPRDVYKVTISRGERYFSFEFGQSLVNSTKYVDRRTKNEYMPDGAALKGNISIVSDIGKNLSDWCYKVKGTPPNEYEILSALTKYDAGSLEDFCYEFGYSTDSKTAEEIYKAVKNEYTNVCLIWTDKEIETLREIN